MGDEDSSDDKRAKAASTATKARFQNIWLSAQDSANERWNLDLRATANLIGFCLFPTGWAWSEYISSSRKAPLPYEIKAEKTSHLTITLKESVTDAGNTARQNGMVNRKDKVEMHLMRMIKRQEIRVTIYDHQMQGYQMSDKMRLDDTLLFNVNSNLIGFHDLEQDRGSLFEADTKSVIAALDEHRFWDTNESLIDWLRINRYLRELFETRGLPHKRDDYKNLAAEWYSEQSATKREPANSTLRELTSQLYKEYSFSDSEI